MSLFTFNVTANVESFDRKLDRIIDLLRQLEFKMAFDLSQLQAQVSAIKDASDAGEALIRGLAAKLDAALAGAADLEEAKTAIAEITQTLKSEAEELGAAITENTPSDPQTP